jgi:UDP-glucuronate 4-epimerase
MARVLVTGAAGFIGRRLCAVLLEAGHDVVGLDSNALGQKAAAGPSAHPNYSFHRRDLVEDDVADLVREVDVVAHHAGRPGVRDSWGETFGAYVRDNIVATQRLLEACRGATLRRLIFASSSAVYGDADTYPTPESSETSPVSPYGVTKLAAERLAVAYAKAYGIPAVCLRYFTVFGPGQRPDMAFSRLIEAAATGTPFPLLGSGEQIRDFTYVDDIAEANLAAIDRPTAPGSVYNVAGGVTATLLDAIATVERLTGRSIAIDRLPAARGDAQRTGADTTAFRDATGWRPRVSLEEGIRAQLAAHRIAPAVKPKLTLLADAISFDPAVDRARLA